MRICVVGSGYVGVVAAACLGELGHEVTCVDNDRKKSQAIARGTLPIHERFLPELFARHLGSRLKFSEDLVAAVKECEAIFSGPTFVDPSISAKWTTYFTSPPRRVLWTKSTVPRRPPSAHWAHSTLSNSHAGMVPNFFSRRPRSATAIHSSIRKKVLLGTRESDQTALRVRRVEALCRGCHHGLRSLLQGGHSHRTHIQHLRTAAVTQRRSRDPQLHEGGGEGAAHRTVTAARHAPSATCRMRSKGSCVWRIPASTNR